MQERPDSGGPWAVTPAARSGLGTDGVGSDRVRAASELDVVSSGWVVAFDDDVDRPTHAASASALAAAADDVRVDLSRVGFVDGRAATGEAGA